MNAIISGRSGRALLIEGDSLKSFEVDDPSALTSRQQADLPYLFGEGTDLRILEDTTIEDVAIELKSNCNFTWALDLTLISLDAELPKDIRKEAVDNLKELLATKDTLTQVENIFYAHPLPEGADVKGTLGLCSSEASSVVQKFLSDLKAFQPKISKVCRAWESIPTMTFGDYEDREAFRTIAVNEGVFRVLAKKSARSLSSFHKASASPAIEMLRNHDLVLEKWYELSHGVPRVAPKKNNQVVARDKPKKRRSSPNVSSDEVVQLVEKSSKTKLLSKIKSVAPTDVSILITGESGTGKELLAHVIHRNSKVTGNFIAVDCSAIPAELLETELFGTEKSSKKKNGLIEASKDGTLLLDGIESLSTTLQFRLLRVLETKTLKRAGRTKNIAFRLIAATNVDLEVLVKEGQFRVDLFYRLQMFTFALTPLRQRKDIDFLALYFAKKAAQVFGLPKPKLNEHLITTLRRYHWPGNLRELEHLMHRLVILSRSSELDLTFVPRRIEGEVLGLRRIFGPFDWEEIEEIGFVESDVIIEVLRKMKGNQVRAARLLGITSTDLRKRLNKTDISNRIHRS